MTLRRPTADPTGPGQESVWSYPRPPKVEPSSSRVEVRLGGEVVCSTDRAFRVLETSHPPGWYLPLADWAAGALEPATGTSYCEWKGVAAYLTVVGGERRAERAAWTYPDPTPGFTVLRDTVAVYPAAMDACLVDGELVAAQDGGFYGGWVTADVVGPFKGGPGSQWW